MRLKFMPIGMASMFRLPRRLVLTGLALSAALASAHCQLSDDAAACCEITPNTELPEGSGRIVVTYPGGDNAQSARYDVYAAGDASTALGGGFGDANLDLQPGTYDVMVSGQRVAGVRVQAGHDTRIRVGVLHVYASDATRIDLFDQASGTSLIGGFGEDLYGLPIGPVAVEVAGQRETALIEDGKITEF
jgi:hypothetical protein